MPTSDPTTNYSWNLPDVGGSAGSWGTALNAILGDTVTGVDAVVKAVSNVANAAMPKAGGVFTGIIEVLTDRYHVNDLGTMSGPITLDMSTARMFCGTVTGNITFSLTNPPATGKAAFLTLELWEPGAFTLTWPAAVKWPGGAPPTFTASGVDIITMYTRDGGTTWRAARAQADSR